MIWNRIFDVKYNYCGFTSAAYLVLQLPMVEVFILRFEQMATAMEFIIHCLIPNLNHLDKVCKGLRSKNSLAFLRLT